MNSRGDELVAVKKVENVSAPGGGRRIEESMVNPFEAMTDYLGEILGSSDREMPSEPRTRDEQSAEPIVPSFLEKEIIQPGCWLQTTVNLSTRQPKVDQVIWARAEAVMLILHILYYLRRPIHGRVRVAMMEQCQELVMELNFYRPLDLG